MNNWPGWATNFPVYNGLDIPGYSCPSSPLPKWRERDNVKLLIPSYVGIAGVSVGATPVDGNNDGILDGTNLTIAGRTSIDGNRASVTAKSNGVLGYLTNVNFKDIRDGSSNTMMIGEQSAFGANDTDISKASTGVRGWAVQIAGVAHRHPTSGRVISPRCIRIGELGLSQARSSHVYVGSAGEGQPGNTPLNSSHWRDSDHPG